MNAKEMLKSLMYMNDMVLTSYLNDLSDSDLMLRPAPQANHLAWQLGHLISSENRILDSIKPGAGGELPAGFHEKHDKAKTGVDDPKQFLTKQQYLDAYKKQRATSAAVLASMNDSDFDGQAPERFRRMFPTVGATFLLIANHPMMHAGQFAVVRRSLGKPVVI